MASTLSKLKETASRVAEECKIKNPENLTLFKFLYQPKPESPVESAIASLERLTRLKREQLFCLLISAFFFYFLLSALPQLASQLIGVGYPLYATSWALRSVDSDPELLKSWLVYWTVYGAFSLIDSLLVPVLLNVAVYWLAKIVFLFYLVCTHPLGTTELLEKGLNPAIDALDRFSSRLFDGSSLPSPPPRKKSDKKK